MTDERDENASGETPRTIKQSQEADVVTLTGNVYHKGFQRSALRPRVIMPLSEILDDIKKCRVVEEPRSITAILRIVYEQLNVRDYSRRHFRFIVYRVIPVAMLLLMIYGAITEGPRMIVAMLIPIGIYMACIRFGPRSVDYRDECKDILEAAIPALRELVDSGLRPKRLYNDDYRTLKTLASFDHLFRDTARILEELV